MPVYSRSKGKWRVVIFHQGRRQDWLIEGTKKDAEAFEARKRVELAEMEPSARRRTVPTFSSFCVEEYTPHAKLHLKPTWWKKQKYLIANLVGHLGDLRLNDIHAAHVEAYARRRLADGLARSSVNNELRSLSRVLGYARELGHPVALAKVRQIRQGGSDSVRAWTDEEVGRLFAECEKLVPDLLPTLVFLANTGCRKGEALALRWEHVDLDARMVHVWPSADWQPKNGKPREIPIGDALMPWLLAKPEKEKLSPWVFPCPRTKRCYAEWPARKFDRVRDAAGLEGGVHQLRHTFASHFLAACPDLYLLARILGHSDQAVTRRYAHLLPDHLARARNAVSFSPEAGPAWIEARLAWRGRNLA